MHEQKTQRQALESNFSFTTAIECDSHVLCAKAFCLFFFFLHTHTHTTR